MDTKALNYNISSSKLLKASKKHNLYPYLSKVIPSKDKAEPKVTNHALKRPEFKIPLTPNLAQGSKKASDLKTKARERTKSINYSANTFQKLFKENTPKEQHEKNVHIHSSKIKNPTRSCIPSPILNRSREDNSIQLPLQEKKINREGGFHRRNQSLLLNSNHLNNLHKEKAQHNNNVIKEKKRVKIFRIDRFAKPQQPQIPQIPQIQPEYYQNNQLFIMNPVIEQELFKEYLGTDKQTFGFEKLVLSGSCDMSQADNEDFNSKMINETILAPKSTKAETKQRVLTKDSSNTIAGMTTNSSSRYKRTLGVTSGFSDRENLDLIELIEWSSDTERNVLMKSPQAQNVIFEETPKIGKENLNFQNIQNIQLRPPKKQTKAITPSVLKNELGKFVKEKGKVTKEVKRRDSSL